MSDAIVAAGCRKVLVSFLSDLLDGGGWWYRLPQMSRETISNETEKHCNYLPANILPRLGRVFGLHEDATAVVIELMNLCTINVKAKKKKHTMRIKI